MELTYYLCSLSIATLIFFMKFTARNDFIELLLKLIGKAVPLFTMFYSGIEIFKHFGLL